MGKQKSSLIQSNPQKIRKKRLKIHERQTSIEEFVRDFEAKTQRKNVQYFRNITSLTTKNLNKDLSMSNSDFEDTPTQMGNEMSMNHNDRKKYATKKSNNTKKALKKYISEKIFHKISSKGPSYIIQKVHTSASLLQVIIKRYLKKFFKEKIFDSVIQKKGSQSEADILKKQKIRSRLKFMLIHFKDIRYRSLIIQKFFWIIQSIWKRNEKIKKLKDHIPEFLYKLFIKVQSKFDQLKGGAHIQKKKSCQRKTLTSKQQSENTQKSQENEIAQGNQFSTGDEMKQFIACFLQIHKQFQNFIVKKYLANQDHEKYIDFFQQKLSQLKGFFQETIPSKYEIPPIQNIHESQYNLLPLIESSEIENYLQRPIDPSENQCGLQCDQTIYESQIFIEKPWKRF